VVCWIRHHKDFLLRRRRLALLLWCTGFLMLCLQRFVWMVGERVSGRALGVGGDEEKTK
jgi:hypothetical protein